MQIKEEYLRYALHLYRQQLSDPRLNKRITFKTTRHLFDAITTDHGIPEDKKTMYLRHLADSDGQCTLDLLQRETTALYHIVPQRTEYEHMSLSEYLKDAHDCVLQQLRARNLNEEISLTEFMDSSVFLVRRPPDSHIPTQQALESRDWMLGILSTSVIRTILHQKEPEVSMELVFGAYRYGECEQERILLTDIDEQIRQDWGNVGGTKGSNCVVEERHLTQAIHDLKQIPKNLVYQPVSGYTLDREAEALQILGRRDQKPVELKSSQMRLYKNDGDGDCLYLALSHFFPIDWKTIKHTIFEKLESVGKHGKLDGMLLRDWVRTEVLAPVGMSDVKNLSVEDYIKYQREPNKWGGTVELLATHALYNRTIYIFVPVPSQPKYRFHIQFGASPTTVDGWNECITLLYSRDSHYEAIKSDGLENLMSSSQ
jgi:hypothetical protein